MMLCLRGLQVLAKNLVSCREVLHEVLLHTEAHLADVALVWLPRRMHRPLMLVHGVCVRELSITIRAFDHDALVEDPDVFRQLRPDGVRLLALVAVVSLLHAVHTNFVSANEIFR